VRSLGLLRRVAGFGKKHGVMRDVAQRLKARLICGTYGTAASGALIRTGSFSANCKAGADSGAYGTAEAVA
jgi:hypothetical protein